MLQGVILLLALLSLPLLRPATLEGWLPAFAILAVSIPAAAGWPRRGLALESALHSVKVRR